MQEEVPHFCPGCGASQRRFDRYPWYFCQACLARAEDGDGRRLVFANVSLSGGLGWTYAGEPDLRDESAAAVFCLIDRRPVLVTEARFGGVVAQPLAGGARPRHAPDAMQVVLTGGDVMRKARERLKRVERR